jgi:hypothetical protein
VKAKVKLLRAHGGCLGTESRRRTWLTAISLGEPSAGVISGDFRMGQPGTGNAVSPYTESIGVAEGTRGTETSKYPEEEKVKTIPPVVASERGTV